jgi:hypothetical protein
MTQLRLGAGRPTLVLATFAALAVGTTFAAGACSSDDPSAPDPAISVAGRGGAAASGGAAGSSAGSAGAAGGVAQAGAAGGGAKGGAAGMGSGGGLNLGGSSGGTAPNECAGDTVQGSFRPVDIHIMLDQSGSMADSGKWAAVKTALLGFANDSRFAGTGVGLQTFPSAAGNAACVAESYTDALLAITPLPDAAPELTNLLNARAPVVGGDTPTRPALAGALTYAREWASQPAHANGTTIVLLATDGEPTICGTDTDSIASLAATAFQDTPSIRTFVVGVGSGFEAPLDAIALSGGTNQSISVDVAGDTTAKFREALAAFGGPAIACNFDIPPPPKGKTLDPTQVNVRLTRNGVTTDLLQAKSSADCGTADDQWFYDNPTAPTRIDLCPATCEAARASMDASSVSLQFGCQTNVAIPK